MVGIDGRYEPYRFHAHAPRGASATAAAVAAAYNVVVTYSPYAKANLDAAYATSLAQIPDGKAKTRGIAFGTLAADNFIAMRANDGRNAPISSPSHPPGVWRPTPPGLPSDGCPMDGKRHSTAAAQWRAVRRARTTASAHLRPLHPRLQ